MDEWDTVEVSYDKYTPRLGIDAPKMSVIVPVMPPRIARVSSSNDLSTRIKRHVTVPELEVGPIVDPLLVDPLLVDPSPLLVPIFLTTPLSDSS